MKMSDLKDVCVMIAIGCGAIAGFVLFALFAMALTAAPFVLIAAGCFYAWKAIIG